MDSYDKLRPGGSGILPEETPKKFFMRHLSAYNFVVPYVKGGEILEIGFGDGYGADFLARHARGVKAIDILDRNVALATSKYKRQNLEFIRMPAIDLAFEDNTFDAVVSFQVIEHLPEKDIIDYLKEIKRVLKRGREAFISTLNLKSNKKPNRIYIKNPFHVKEFVYEEFDSTIKEVFGEYKIYGLFYTPRLKFYERLKKLGFFRFFPSSLNPVKRFYNNITVTDFLWSDKNLSQCIDFMACCKK